MIILLILLILITMNEFWNNIAYLTSLGYLIFQIEGEYFVTNQGGGKYSITNESTKVRGANITNLLLENKGHWLEGIGDSAKVIQAINRIPIRDIKFNGIWRSIEYLPYSMSS